MDGEDRVRERRQEKDLGKVGNRYTNICFLCVVLYVVLGFYHVTGNIIKKHFYVCVKCDTKQQLASRAYSSADKSSSSDLYSELFINVLMTTTKTAHLSYVVYTPERPSDSSGRT